MAHRPSGLTRPQGHRHGHLDRDAPLGAHPQPWPPLHSRFAHPDPTGRRRAAGVFCWYVLHHVPDDDLAIAVRELARITAPGGFLMLGGHVGDSSYIKTEGYGGLPMRVLFARRSPQTYADLLRHAGLTVDATIELGPDHPTSGAVWLARRPA